MDRLWEDNWLNSAELIQYVVGSLDFWLFWTKRQTHLIFCNKAAKFASFSDREAFRTPGDKILS